MIDIIIASAVELIDLGDRTQAQGHQALDNIIQVVEQGNQLADQITSSDISLGKFTLIK